MALRTRIATCVVALHCVAWAVAAHPDADALVEASRAWEDEAGAAGRHPAPARRLFAAAVGEVPDGVKESVERDLGFGTVRESSSEGGSGDGGGGRGGGGKDHGVAGIPINP